MKFGLKQEGCFLSWKSSCSKKVLWPWNYTHTHKKSTDIFVRLYTSSGFLMNNENTNFTAILLKGLATTHLNIILSRKCKETFALVWNFLTLGCWDAFKYKNHVY